MREGNEPTTIRNYEFISGRMEAVKKTGKQIARVRSDSAAYQEEVFKYISKELAKYNITVSKDISVMESIKNKRN